MISNFVMCVVLMVLSNADGVHPGCTLPPHPDHGRYVPYDLDCPEDAHSPSCQGVPGSSVPDNWILFLRCNHSYHTDSNASDIPSVCISGQWTPPLSSCVEIERQNTSGCQLPNFPAKGSYEALAVECGLEPTFTPSVGTEVPSDCVVLYSCAPGYQLAQPDHQLISVCQHSTWDPPSHTFSCTDTSPTPTPTTAPTSQPPSSGCVLPNESANRTFCPFWCKVCSSQPGGNCSYPPGSSVRDVALKVQCRQGYGLPDNPEYVAIVCLDGRWFPDIPACQKLCPPLESDSVYPQCQYGTTRVDCSQWMLPSTTAMFQCRPSYSEYPGLAAEGVYRRTITCRQNGKWSHTIPECKPVCGVSKGDAVITPTIVDGTDTPLGVFPWHVGLYTRNVGKQRTWKNICGGSLISNRIVLTAAHCVVLLEPSELRVAMGKYYRSWDHDEEHAVTRRVSTIRIPGEYLGAVTTYAWDIALVLLRETVQFTSFVMPVCRDISHQFEITRNNTGYVVGWGRTDADGLESETLLSNNLSILDHGVCRRRLPQILAFDKFCGDKASVSVAEKGDSGGGLTAVFGGLHYIFGIVSLKHNNLTVFTNISWNTHLLWIEQELVEFNKRTDY